MILWPIAHKFVISETGGAAGYFDGYNSDYMRNFTRESVRSVMGGEEAAMDRKFFIRTTWASCNEDKK